MDHDQLANIAKQNWLHENKPYNKQLVSELYEKCISVSYSNREPIQQLEVSYYLEKYEYSIISVCFPFFNCYSHCFSLIYLYLVTCGLICNR